VNEKSLIIIGGGVIGLCAAYYAVHEGWRVTIIERGEPAHDSCSLGNAGMIVPSHIVPLAAPGMVGLGIRMLGNPESPFAIRPRLSSELADWGLKFVRSCTEEHVTRSAPLLRDLNLTSRRLYEELDTEIGDFGLMRRGLLMLCKTAHGLEEETRFAARANALGVPAEVLTPAQTAALDPGITMDIAGAIFFPKDCHLSPQRFVALLTQRLQQGGATFLWNTEVTGWRTKPDGSLTAVQTKTGDVVGDEFVLAGGAWSSQLAQMLRLKIPMQAGKGYSLTVDAPRRTPEICSILTEARVAVTPMSSLQGSTLRFGGTMELGGLDLSINAARVRGILKSVPAYYPDFTEKDFVGLPVWSGLRPCSPDGLPYLGRAKTRPNLIFAAGHAMMGLSLAPVTGKIVADLLAHRKPDLDISLLRPERWAN